MLHIGTGSADCRDSRFFPVYENRNFLQGASGDVGPPSYDEFVFDLGSWGGLIDTRVENRFNARRPMAMLRSARLGCGGGIWSL